MNTPLISKDHPAIQKIIQKCISCKDFLSKKKALENSKIWKVGLDGLFLSPESKFVMQKGILTLQYPPNIHFSENQIIGVCNHFSYLVKELIAPSIFPNQPLEYWHLSSKKYGFHHIGVKVNDSPDLISSTIYGVPRFFQNADFLDDNYPIKKIEQDAFSCIDVEDSFPFQEVMDKDWIYLTYVDIALEKPDWLILPKKDEARFKNDFLVLTVAMLMNPLKKKKQMQRYMIAMLVPYKDFFEDCDDFQEEEEQIEEDHFRVLMDYLLFDRTPSYQRVLNNYLSKNTLLGEIPGDENTVVNISPESFSKNMKDLIWNTYKRVLMRLSRDDFIEIMKEKMKCARKKKKEKKAKKLREKKNT